MMAFILILMVTSGANLSLTTARFESELACETAVLKIQREFKKPIDHVCTPASLH